MTQQIAVRTGSQLEITSEQTFFTDTQIAGLEQIGVRGASPADLGVFFHQVQRTGLDPFARQIYMIQRKGKWTIQTGIDGFRLIARRATDMTNGTLGYGDTMWADANGRWYDVWLQEGHPAAARVIVKRNGSDFPAIALFHEYAGRKSDGALNQMWKTKSALMLEKCAEALALRKAFPQDLSGLYTTDEMGQADNPSPRQELQAARPVQNQPQQQAQPQQRDPQVILQQELGAKPVDHTPVEQWEAIIADATAVEDLNALYPQASSNPAWDDQIKPLFTQRKHELQQSVEPEPAEHMQEPLDAELVS